MCSAVTGCHRRSMSVPTLTPADRWRCGVGAVGSAPGSQHGHRTGRRSPESRTGRSRRPGHADTGVSEYGRAGLKGVCRVSGRTSGLGGTDPSPTRHRPVTDPSSTRHRPVTATLGEPVTHGGPHCPSPPPTASTAVTTTAKNP